MPPFDALYREHFGFVYRSLLRLGVPSASIEDAVQDVFVTVHRRMADFEGRSTVRSWLFGIARRVGFRHRRTALRVEHRRRVLADDALPPAAGPAESLELARRSAQLLRALEHLDEDKRSALTLHVFEDLRGPEVAEMLGINVDTAYSRIKAARRELTRALVEMGANDDEATLVDATKRATTPDRNAARRVAAAVALRVGVGAGKVATATFVGYKGVLAAIAIGATAAIGVGLQDRGAPPMRTSPRAAEIATAPALLEDATPIPAEIAPPHGELEPPAPQGPVPVMAQAPRRAAPIERAPETDPVAAALAAEVALLTAAKTALDRGDAPGALDRLSEHARTFPAGQLVTERQGYRAIALCDAGKAAAGRGEARLFVAAHPDSSLITRVLQACEISSVDR